MKVNQIIKFAYFCVAVQIQTSLPLKYSFEISPSNYLPSIKAQFENLTPAAYLIDNNE